MQTVMILFPGLWIEIQAMEEIPVCPVLYNKNPVSITSIQNVSTPPRGTITTWHPCGTVYQRLPNGTLKMWRQKPTLQDAVLSKPKGDLFQFHTDGSVTYRSLSNNRYWGPSKKAEPLEGVINRAHESLHKTEQFCTYDCCETADCLCETRPPQKEEPDPMMRYSFWTASDSP